MAKFSDVFTQGGQTELHKLHMIRQVLGATIKASIILGLVFFIILLFWRYNWQDFWFLGAFFKAKLRAQLGFLPHGFMTTSWVQITPGRWQEISDHVLMSNVACIKLALHVQYGIIKCIMQSLLFMLVLILGISCFWVFRGNKRQNTSIIKGFTIVDPRVLKKIVNKLGSSPIHIAHVPMLKNSECQHLMITGTTGTGKSNAINSLLMQIRALGHRAVVLDTTGNFVNDFYQEGDQLLNPLDQRSRKWNLWQECRDPQDFADLAEVLIPQGSHDPIWTEGPRKLLAEVALLMAKNQKEPTIKKLLELLLKAPLSETMQFVKGTIAASMVDPQVEKAALSIRMILGTCLNAFEYLNDVEPDFVIGDWVRAVDQKDWLFLSCLTSQRALITPLLSVWLSIAVKSLMRLPPCNNRKLWFIIDELGTLQKLPMLLTALAEVRKYGGCFVLGFQDIWQLESIYGKGITYSISGLTGSKLIFRTEEPITAKRMADCLGEQEIMESAESISYGAHEMRDGVNLSKHHKIKSVVSGSDIMQLKNLSAYLKLPGGLPVTKVGFEYVQT